MVANYRYFVASGSGTWTAPRTGLFFLFGSGGGGGGGGGYASAGGGAGGGASGKFLMGLPVYLASGDTIAYSIGSLGGGGPAGSNGTAGTATTLAITSTNEMFNGQTITLNGGGGGSAGASTNGGNGGSISGVITGGAGGTGAGANGARMSTAMGGGAMVGANSGAAGGAVNFAGGSTSGVTNLPGYLFSDSSSNAGTSSASNGGGGGGGATVWGNGGTGGKAATSTAPTSGTGYGAGGGGGYGSVGGAAGTGGFFEVLNYDNIPASLPTMASDWITSAGVSAGAVTKIQNGLSTYNGSDTSGTTTLLSRIASALTITGGKVDINDKTGFSLTSAYDAAKTALTSLGTNAPSGWINAAAIAVSALNGKGDWSTYAGGDTSGTTTLLSRVVGTVAAGTHNPQSGDAYARLGAPIGASISADIQTITVDNAAIADAVWDEVLSGHSAAGTAGKALQDSSSAGDPWATVVPGAYTDGTAGKLFGKLDVGEPSDPVIVIPGSPQDATTARVYGYFKTLENISATAIPVKFTLLPKEAVKATTILVPEVVNASIKNGQLIDDNGNLYVTLILNESITPTGTYYQVEIPKASINKTFYLNSSTITNGLFDLATVIG